MNQIYRIANNIANIIKVVCTTAAVFYGLAWLLHLANLSLTPIEAVFDPLADIVRIFFNISVDFSGRAVDMTYIITAVVLLLLYPVFSVIGKFCVAAIEQLEAAAEKKREREVRMVNARLDKEYKSEIYAYSRFIFLFEFNFTLMVDPNLMAYQVDLAKLKQECYTKMKTLIRAKYTASVGIENEKIHFAIDDFSIFDKFLPDFLGVVSSISNKNREIEVNTSFNLTIDALRQEDKKSYSLALMEKISTFNYRNRAITTGAFATRYNLQEVQDFRASTIGVSRFFEKEVDENGNAKYVDFELFSLKKKQKNHFETKTLPR